MACQNAGPESDRAGIVDDAIPVLGPLSMLKGAVVLGPLGTADLSLRELVLHRPGGELAVAARELVHQSGPVVDPVDQEMDVRLRLVGVAHDKGLVPLQPQDRER